MGSEREGGLAPLGIFTMTAGPLAPDGGFRQCRVMATRGGDIVLMPLHSDHYGAIIRTVSETELLGIMDIFHALPARCERIS